MTDIYTGQCFGGPNNGQSLAHESKCAVYYTWKMSLDTPAPDKPIDETEIGHYRWIGGMWIWTARKQ